MINKNKYINIKIVILLLIILVSALTFSIISHPIKKIVHSSLSFAGNVTSITTTSVLTSSIAATTTIPQNTTTSNTIPFNSQIENYITNQTTLVSDNFNAIQLNSTPALTPAQENVLLSNVISKINSTALTPNNVPIINQTTINLTYGIISQNNKALFANDTVYYVSIQNGSVINNTNEDMNTLITNTITRVNQPRITFTKYKIFKNQNYICMNLSSSLFSHSFCSSGTYHLPIQNIGRHFGINGPSSVSITATLQSSLIGTQTEPFNALITSGGTTVFSSNMNTTNSFLLTKTFQYNAGDALNITLDGLGNSNYSLEDPTVSPPAGILYYLPVNIINRQNAGEPANAQIKITLNTALLQPYVTNTLNNTEWFYANGVVINSWLLGNVANLLLPTNQLAGNYATWYLLDSNSLNAFPGSMTINTVYYIGMSSNIPGSGNLLLSYPTVGEAPQLSCYFLTNTITGCAAGQYGQYDNGNSVFTTYTNFAGTSCPPNLKCSAGIASDINNGISFYGNNAVNSISLFNSANYILEGAGNFVNANAFQQFGWFNSIQGSEYGTLGCSGSTCSAGTGNYNLGNAGASAADMKVATGLTMYIMSSWTNTLTSNNIGGSINYIQSSITDAALPNARQMFFRLTFAADKNALNDYTQYLYLRSMTPNSIDPTTANQPLIAVGTSCNFATSNAAINFGSLPINTNTIGTSGSYNVITVTNLGTSTSNILLSGSNWNYNANTFDETNTIWSSTSGNNAYGPLVSSSQTRTSNVEIQLQDVATDTLVFTSNAVTTNTIWFGANVPKSIFSGTYSQTVNIISSC